MNGRTPLRDAIHELLNWRVLIALAVMVGVFAAAVAWPTAIPLSSMWAVVLASATFAAPIGVAGMSAVGMALSVVNGWLTDSFGNANFWVRMVTFATIGALSVLLAYQRARREALLHERAVSDPLTGLGNRRLLLGKLDVHLELRQRIGDIAVLYTDLDGFKQVNDTFGHAAGDQVLIRVGERLQACSRSTDTVARFGGDEFVVACPAVGNHQEVAKLCDRILHAFEEPIGIEQGAVMVGITIGAVLATPDSAATAADLVDAADLALTECKSATPGGYRVVRI